MEKLFDLRSKKGIKQAERFKSSLENKGFWVSTNPWGFDGVKIKGIKPVCLYCAKSIKPDKSVSAKDGAVKYAVCLKCRNKKRLL